MLEDLIRGENIRSTIEQAIGEFHSDGPVNPATLEKLSLIKKYNNDVFVEYESKLLSVMGLFYKLGDPNSLLEAVYENFGKAIEDQFGHKYTPMQACAYKSITSRLFYSFSAPTSTGKSHLFRELIKEHENDIVIVVPSRALIAEFYSEVIKLVGKDVLVLQFVENVNQLNTSRRIYIITPERGIEIFKYADEFDIGLFLFDEAQISEEPIRGISFDSFVRRAHKVFPGAKKVFAHPFVLNPEAQIVKHDFKDDSQSNNFRQRNVGKIFIAREKDGTDSYFSPFSETEDCLVGYDIVKQTLLNKGTVLIYISKAKILSGGHIEYFDDYIELCPIIEEESAINIIGTLKKYIGASNGQLGKQSSFIKLMQRGVVVHHGSMPLKARLLIESFVRNGFAKLCFATSTLNQGINMPFDCVFIDNFNRMDELTLKNLIGRAGRSSNIKKFDYGYTVINRANVATFTSRINEEIVLTETSKLDADIESIHEDYSDVVEAIKTDSFNDDLHLTNAQVDRIKSANLIVDIKYVLDKLFDGSEVISATEYYGLGDSVRRKIKEKLKKIYCSHLKKSDLSIPEKTVLSTAIPLLLWKVRGKSFSETISLRYSFLTERDERRKLKRQLRENIISQLQYDQQFGSIKIRYSARAESLPNSQLTAALPLFSRNALLKDFDYDLLVYDTYDYLDKVISLSLSDPISAALTIYYEETNDERAQTLRNYLKYGTDDEVEIWLIKYGFDPEDLEWISDLIEHIDENGIIFQDDLSSLDDQKISLLQRYL